MMNCEEVTRVAGDLAERKLWLGERLKVLFHIAMCKGCRAFVEQFRLTILGLRSLPQPAPVTPPERLLERFRGEFRGQS